jgi:hypothetical protein
MATDSFRRWPPDSSELRLESLSDKPTCRQHKPGRRSRKLDTKANLTQRQPLPVWAAHWHEHLLT